jgi:hypothetical protein
MPDDKLQIRFGNSQSITRSGPSLTTHNSMYVEASSLYRIKFVINNYESNEDITGLIKDDGVNSFGEGFSLEFF